MTRPARLGARRGVIALRGEITDQDRKQEGREMPDGVDDLCVNCRHWRARNAESDLGTCHRYAPEPKTAPAGEYDVEWTRAWWPITDFDDGCGEFEDRNKRAPTYDR